jgi:hypothetical protein
MKDSIITDESLVMFDIQEPGNCSYWYMIGQKKDMEEILKNMRFIDDVGIHIDTEMQIIGEMASTSDMEKGDFMHVGTYVDGIYYHVGKTYEFIKVKEVSK